MDLNTRLIPLDDITIPEISLRDVKTDSEKFLDLVESIYNYGVGQTIGVLEDKDNPGKFILSDGKHRLTASMVARDRAKEKKDKRALNLVSLIPARIEDFPIEEIPFRQIQMNMHRIETSQIEYARQVRRIWAQPQYAGMTKQQLYVELGVTKSPAWFDMQLGLGHLCTEISELVDEGKISISAAYSLAKLPAEDQLLWMDRAQTDSVADLTNAINARLQEIKLAKRGQTKEKDPLDDIKPKKKNDFKSKIIDLINQINSDPNNVPLAQFAQGVMWGCSMDAESVAAKEKKEQEEKEKRDKILALRREKILAMQKANMPSIEAEVKKELGLA